MRSSLLDPRLGEAMSAAAAAKIDSAIVDLEHRGILVGRKSYCCELAADEGLRARASEIPGLLRPWGFAFVFGVIQDCPFAEEIVFKLAAAKSHPVRVPTRRAVRETFAEIMRQHGLAAVDDSPFVRIWHPKPAQSPAADSHAVVDRACDAIANMHDSDSDNARGLIGGLSTFARQANAWLCRDGREEDRKLAAALRPVLLAAIGTSRQEGLL
jgi:hypothetical protein